MDERSINRFEKITRKAFLFSRKRDCEGYALAQHAFDERNIHDSLPQTVCDLFDNGHYSHATFEAFKYLDKLVQTIAKSSQSGRKLMMDVFSGDSPAILLNKNVTTSEKDEQEGFKFIFAGAILAIRNPRGHEYLINDSPDQCLDYLSLVSLLMRKLEEAGYSVNL